MQIWYFNHIYIIFCELFYNLMSVLKTDTRLMHYLFMLTTESTDKLTGNTLCFVNG